jgi:hypothetical protein
LAGVEFLAVGRETSFLFFLFHAVPNCKQNTLVSDNMSKTWQSQSFIQANQVPPLDVSKLHIQLNFADFPETRHCHHRCHHHHHHQICILLVCYIAALTKVEYSLQKVSYNVLFRTMQLIKPQNSSGLTVTGKALGLCSVVFCHAKEHRKRIVNTSLSRKGQNMFQTKESELNIIWPS